MTDPTQPDQPEEITPSVPPPPVYSSPYPGQQVTTGRPALVIVVAVALFVFAAFAAFSLVTNIISLSGPQDTKSMIPRDVILNQTILKAIALLIYVTMGIGLLTLASWARKATIFSLLGLFVLGCVFIFWMWSQMEPILPPGSGMTVEQMRSFLLIVFIIMEVLTAIVLTLIIVALTRPNVKAAFNEG